ncbi:hypothetical protein ES332_D02G226000v1 [Gossypium tomentosum]|uniref:Translation initiation factor 5A C-terminal domain-containing protein n=2 Tax=Gossypium tomentosum TaxID=34277 RepID=A0A5D2M0T8_GOSTO|nr:hypothetical protein ES332_D02G226000v1 [Gossypium tomentosum]
MVEAQVEPPYPPDYEVRALREIATELGKKDWNYNENPCNNKSISQDINSLKHIALMEAKMKKLSDLLSKTIEQTKENVVKKLALTYEEMEQECNEIMDGFAEGKDLVVSVMSAMGEEQICALKDIGPK